MLNRDNAYSDDLLSTSWLGEVVDIEDPQKIGRIKVKVYGKFDQLKTEDIPWAYPANNYVGGSKTGGGFFSVPKVGSIVSIKFDMGNIYHPEYYFEQKISDELKKFVGEDLASDYPKNDGTATTHVLLFDSSEDKNSVKIYFSTSKGLMLDFQKSSINIKPDKSIEIQTASGDSKIQILDDGTLNITQKKDVIIKCDNAKITAESSIHLDCSKEASVKLGSSVTDSIILGDQFKSYFDTHTHIGNMGAPTSPPMTPMPPTTLSKTVKTQ